MTGEMGSTQLSELRLGEFSIRSWRFYEIKFPDYMRTRSAYNVIPILWIKSEYNLILPSHPHSYVTFSILLIFYFFSLGLYYRNWKLGLEKLKLKTECESLFYNDWKYSFCFHIYLMYFMILCRVSKIGNLLHN